MTWEEIEEQEQVTPANYYRAFINLFGSVWMWGDNTKVYISTDNGLTHRDATGNLLSSFGFARMLNVGAIDYMA